eukprot:XP_019921972.1 PREDICTED: uncharacterized protein LOC105326355 [Crassostrea gigas]
MELSSVERAIKRIGQRVNKTLYDTKRRTWEEVKKKYYNVKSRSKEKLDGVKRPKTGGGPPLPPLTQGEETFLCLADGEPHLSGLQGGIDTDGDLQFDYYLNFFNSSKKKKWKTNQP